LNAPEGTGVTKRDHLKQVERQLGHTPEDLKEPVKFPSLLGNVWVAFCRLSNTRSQSYTGVNPINQTDIKSWMELTNTKLRPHEIDTLLRLDQTFLRKANG